MASLTPEEFDRLAAIDSVLPFDHCSRMLGLIAHLVTQYLEIPDPEDVSWLQICQPWLTNAAPSPRTARREMNKLRGQGRSL